MTENATSLAARLTVSGNPDGSGQTGDPPGRPAEPGNKTDTVPVVGDFLDRCLAGSPFLAGFANRYPDEMAQFFSGAPETGLAAILDDAEKNLGQTTAFSAAAAILRRARLRAGILVSLADLGGVWSVDEVIEALSVIANRLVSGAVRY
ncbi:MAG: hypothetical protein ACC634_08155, partial [Hyphomicrobiales bacterium]